MKVFVTGGSGFIGRHLVRKLVERGYQVQALARSEASAAIVAELGATAVRGDITDTASMRQDMAGSDVVFHVAGWYQLGATDWTNAEVVNVSGTRKVLRLAHELGIPKIVYTSTVTVLGDTRGKMVDESFYQAGPFLTEYDRTKWLAHYKVAVPLIEKGAPIIIVMPGVAFGPGDTSSVTEMMRLFYRGLPVLPGPETTLTYAHVEDVVEGHILAAEKGRLGESYLLTGPAIPLGEMVDYWAHLTGKRAPALRLPADFLRPLAPIMGALAEVVPIPPLFSQEAVRSLGATYTARSDKARNELGWQTRPLQTGLVETFDWIAATEPERADGQERQIAGALALVATLLLFAWMVGRRRRIRHRK